MKLFCPVVTPFFGSRLVVSRRLLVDHCRTLLATGCDGLVPFGTNSEAASLSAAERVAGLEAILEDGIAPGVLLPGTGATNLHDAVTLTRHALEVGCLGAMVMPPPIFREATADGVVAFFRSLIRAVGPHPSPWLYLYNFPRLAPAVTAPVAAAVFAEFPDAVAGVKDSAGDAAQLANLVAAVPGRRVFAGTEALCATAAQVGAAGLIVAGANVNARGLRAALDAVSGGRDTSSEAAVAALGAASRVREVLAAGGPVLSIPTLKAALGRLRGEPTWGNVRPPLVPAGAEVVAGVVAALAREGVSSAVGGKCAAM